MSERRCPRCRRPWPEGQKRCVCGAEVMLEGTAGTYEEAERMLEEARKRVIAALWRRQIPELLADLEAKAKQAKQGPVGGEEYWRKRLDYLEACSPDRILALIEYIRELEAKMNG